MSLPSDPHSIQFFSWYGIAMMNWQSVEHELFVVYRSSFVKDSSLEAAAAYYSLDSFGAKRKLVSSTLKVMLVEPHLSNWSKLEGKLRTAAASRNQLAHRSVSAAAGLDAFHGLFLTAAPSVPPAMTRAPPRIDVAELERLSVEFAQLGRDVRAFAEALPNYRP